MTIEEAIQQKRPFRNDYQRVIVNLIYTHNWLTDKIKQELKPFGITMKQYNVLRILRGADGPISTSAIRERLLDKMSDASRMVERMHQRGLVIRISCPNDRRLVDVSLSEKGATLLAKMDEYIEKTDAVVNAITPEEAKVLNSLLDKVRDSKG